MAFVKPEVQNHERKVSHDVVKQHFDISSQNQCENTETFMTSLIPGNSEVQPENQQVRKARRSKEFNEFARIEKLSFVEAVNKHPVFECRIDLESPRTVQAMQKLSLKPDDLQIKDLTAFVQIKGDNELARMSYIHHLNKVHHYLEDVKSVKTKITQSKALKNSDKLEKLNLSSSLKPLDRRGSEFRFFDNHELERRKQKIQEEHQKHRRQYTEVGLQVLRQLLDKQEKLKDIRTKQDKLRMFAEIREHERKIKIEKSKQRSLEAQAKVRKQQEIDRKKLLSISVELEKRDHRLAQDLVRNKSEKKMMTLAKEKFQQNKMDAVENKIEKFREAELLRSMELLQSINERDKKMHESFEKMRAERELKIKQKQVEFQEKVTQARSRQNSLHKAKSQKVISKLEEEKLHMEKFSEIFATQKHNKTKELMAQNMMIELNRKVAERKIKEWKSNILKKDLENSRRIYEIKEKQAELIHERTEMNNLRKARTVDNLLKLNDLSFQKGSVILARHREIKQKLALKREEKELFTKEMRELEVSSITAKNHFLKELEKITKSQITPARASNLFKNSTWGDERTSYLFSSQHVSPKNSMILNNSELN